VSPSHGGGNELLKGFGDRKTICAFRGVSKGSSPTSSPPAALFTNRSAITSSLDALAIGPDDELQTAQTQP
jgi:hypothetical protein